MLKLQKSFINIIGISLLIGNSNLFDKIEREEIFEGACLAEVLGKPKILLKSAISL